MIQINVLSYTQLTPDPKSVLRSYDNSSEFNIEKGDSEQEFRDQQEEAAAEAEVVYKSPVWSYTRTALYKMFGVLDIVLLTYRVAKLYIVIAQLIRGFPEVITQSVTEKKIAANKELAEEFERKLRQSKEKTRRKMRGRNENDDDMDVNSGDIELITLNKRPPGLIAPLLKFCNLLGNPPINTTKGRDLIFNEGIRLLNMADNI